MQKLIEAGEITAEEAEQSERRNIILQALGPEPVIRTDLTHQHIRRGDTLVVCSDGLSGQMRVDDIGRVITEESNLPAACMKLIDLANANGGPDNITVVAARFEGEGLAPPSARDPIGHAVYPFGGDVTPQMPIGRFTTGATPTTPTDGKGPAGVPLSQFAARGGATTARKGTPVLLVLGLVALVVLAALAAYRMLVTE